MDFGPERLVIYVPPGGKRARAFGFFAIAWIGIVAVVTGGFVGAGPDLIFPFVFLGFFWLVGLVMAYIALRMSFTRLHILLEPGRLFVQRTLLGRKWLKETVLTNSSRAQLVESYRENHVPVYRVEVNGGGRTAKFGTSLSEQEKHWFVETINQFLGVEGAATSSAAAEPRECFNCGAELAADAISPGGHWKCASCGAEGAFAVSSVSGTGTATGEAVAALEPAALPVDSDVSVDYAASERLAVHLPLLPAGKARSIAVAVGFVSGVFWMGIVGFFLANFARDAKDTFDWLAVAFLGLVGLAALIPLGIAAAAARGRISVTVDEAVLSCRWHWGLLGFRKEIATPMIERVSVAPAMEYRTGGTGATSHSDLKACFVHFRGGSVPLTTFHGAETARTVGGLVRYQLERLGIALSDE